MKLRELFAAIAAAVLSACLFVPSAFAANATISSNQNWQGGAALTEDSTWTFQGGAVLTLKEPVTVPNGVTLTLKGWGTVARYSTNADSLFIVAEGGKLVVEGADDSPVALDGENAIAIDGKSVIASAPLIKSSGTLEFEKALVQNGKNRSVDSAGKPNGTGGGIRVDSTGSLTMNNCIVTRNTSSRDAGGIYCAGPMTVSNSTISHNHAVFSETGNGVVNAGRGGGFYLAGESAVGAFENVIVSDNVAMYYGGGGQVASKASFTMSGDSVFSSNKAILHGAGALHVTASATFTMNGGLMTGNTAQTVGGAIHSSYTCVLNLNKGEIKDNVANGRGGGVHVNTGGSLTLSDGIVISGNTANNLPTGSYADVDEAGDSWINVKYEGPHTNNGYGGGVLVDSGTCTVDGAVITGNHAAVGGGGIALVMLNAPSTHDNLGMLLVVNFDMRDGLVSGNTTDGNGAGVFLMSNGVKENIERDFGEEGSEAYENAVNNLQPGVLEGVPEAAISGGVVEDNVAAGNGGGLYLDETTKFIIDGGEVLSNEAQNGAGVYVAKGIAEIRSGAMSGNAASSEGGALYIDGSVTVGLETCEGDGHSHPVLSGNSAVNGGGIAVASGTPVMYCASLLGNTATENGGSIYVANGGLLMYGGTVSGGLATGEVNAKLGGGVYLSDGNFTMMGGSLSGNAAFNGGGAYVSSGDFRMVSGEVSGNAAVEGTLGQAAAGREGYGGGAYAASGNIYIGVEGCGGDTAEKTRPNHTVEYEGLAHPEVLQNSAVFGGGFAVKGGNVYAYCGCIVDNVSDNKGTGMNVFMADEGSQFHHYFDSTEIGSETDHGMVSVGGELTVMHSSGDAFMVDLTYYSNKIMEDGVEITWSGSAPQGYYLNLPYCPAEWQEIQASGDNPKSFVGWTTSPLGAQASGIRDKSAYLPVGTPVMVDDLVGDSGTQNGDIYFYAVWAPRTNYISYAYTIDGENIVAPKVADGGSAAEKADADATVQVTGVFELEGAPESYSFSMVSSAIPVGTPTKAGYVFKGWVMYADCDTISSWGMDPNLEPYAAGPTLMSQLVVLGSSGQATAFPYLAGDMLNTQQSFGDITLVAVFEPIYGTVTISKSLAGNAAYAVDGDQVFVFRITGTTDAFELDDVDMDITLCAGESIELVLPAGDYSVAEDASWAWRYTTTCEQFVDLDVQGETVSLDYANHQTNSKWLNFFGIMANVFTG